MYKFTEQCSTILPEIVLACAALRAGKTIIQNSMSCLQQNTIKANRVVAAIREIIFQGVSQTLICLMGMSHNFFHPLFFGFTLFTCLIKRN